MDQPQADFIFFRFFASNFLAAAILLLNGGVELDGVSVDDLFLRHLTDNQTGNLFEGLFIEAVSENEGKLCVVLVPCRH
jgi:hypothetical protein